MTPEEALDRAFAAAVDALRPLEGEPRPTAITPELFDAMAASRQLDLAARGLSAQGLGYHTVGSAGHESDAVIAAALRPSDPALLHYRSGAFYLTRAGQVEDHDGVPDIALGFVAAADEPIAGGRHKVLGHPRLAVIPQTSTIGSHLPRAVGIAFAIERARRLAVACRWPSDAVVVASFGDASANHSTTTGAINAAAQAAYQHLPMPLLFVCEDNGFGISVRTPEGWIEAAYSHRAGLRYLKADGTDLEQAFKAAHEAVDHVRTKRAPAFLHLRTVRYLGHAGSDAEAAYRTPSQLTADLARDPLVAAARLLVDSGTWTPEQVRDRYEAIRERVAKVVEQAATHRSLASVEEVMAPLSPRHPDPVAEQASRAADPERRAIAFEGRLPEDAGPLPLADSINRTLVDVLSSSPEALVFGEDVGRKGGVYGVTRGLVRRFGTARVFDTLLDEQTILGLALGLGISGLLPIPEIQYLAYLHNAEDQLRGEAATLSFFSSGAFRNPMVVRVAGLAYQKGFGGHFHNDNSLAVLRDIPGLVVAVPSRGDDAAAMLRTCVAAAQVDGTVSVFVEPIALYHTRDLHHPGDGRWATAYQPPSAWADTHIPIGRARRYGDGGDLTIVTFCNGVPMSLRVAQRLQERGVGVRVIDLRWLSPLPLHDLVREATATGRVLVADETRHSGGVAEPVLAALVDARYAGRMARVNSADSPVPLGPSAEHVLLSEAAIERAATALLGP